MESTLRQWIERNANFLLDCSKLVITLKNEEVESQSENDFMETIDSGIYVAKKVPYLLTAYDDECRLKNNPKIQIIKIAYSLNGLGEMVEVAHKP